MNEFLARRWLASALAAGCGVAQAASWEFAPQLTVGATYTDNVELAPEGLDESEFVTEIRPSLVLRRDGGRFDAELGYQLQHFMFSRDSDRNESYHNLTLSSSSELLTERFYLDVNGGYGQAIVDPERPIPVSNVLLSGNLTDYWSADFNPYWVQRIGARTQLRVDYNWGVVRYPDFDLSAGNNLDSFDRQAVGVRLESQRNEPGLQWSLEYRAQRADYEDFDTFKYDTAAAMLGVPVSRQLALVGRFGMESEVQDDPRRGGLDAEFWEAGFRWEPSARNRLEARVGDRFFGDTYYFSWEMQGSRLNTSVSYNEAPTTFSLEQLNPTRILIRDGPTPVYDIIALTSDVYVNRELVADAVWTAPRSEILLRARDVRREYITTPGDDRESGIGLGWYWRLGPRTQLSTMVYGGRIEFRNTTVRDELTQVALGVSRLLGPRTLLDLSFRYDQRRSNTQQRSNEYTERAVVLTFTRSFGREGVAFGGPRSLPGMGN